MAAPREFTLDAVRDFMLERGGKVTNHELVKHFKQFLTDPYTKEYARVQFKEYVNTLATIRQEETDKFLVLKSKFLPASPGPFTMPPQPPYYPPPPPSQLEAPIGLPGFRAPPPYRPPPEPLHLARPSPPPPPPPQQQQPPPPPVFHRQLSFPTEDFIPASAYLIHPSERAHSVQDLSQGSSSFDAPLPPPAVPPRRFKSQGDDKENNFTASASSLDGGALPDHHHHHPNANAEEVKISVKERTQRFNKMASQVDLLGSGSNKDLAGRPVTENGGRSAKSGSKVSSSSALDDEDETSSLGTMEPRSKEWMLASARGDYHGIARLLRDEPRLARRRDFVTYTGLHWAAKHGNDALVKMLAGTYKSDVNARTNAGCTPLHIAAQQGHEEVFDLLVKTYGADSNLRDYSGKKPYQYFPRRDSVISSDTFRKITAKRNLAAEKEAAVAAGFLRIGSLNVRVKKTTEAFNNLLSSAAGGTDSSSRSSSKWGSVDNLISSSDSSLMPPPNNKAGPAKKKNKHHNNGQGQPMISAPTLIHHTHSTSFSMAGPVQPMGIHKQVLDEEEDPGNDSDSAYGFGNGWQH